MLLSNDYTYAGQLSPDSMRYTRTDSTQTLKRDLTVSRKAASYNPKTEVFSVPTYRITGRFDIPNTSGLPIGQRGTIDLELRYPVGMTQSDLTTLVADIEALLSQESFINDVIQQKFPRESTN